MTCEKVVEEIMKAGFKIEPEAGKLILHGDGELTKELRELIRQHKEELHVYYYLSLCRRADELKRLIDREGRKALLRAFRRLLWEIEKLEERVPLEKLKELYPELAMEEEPTNYSDMVTISKQELEEVYREVRGS